MYDARDVHVTGDRDVIRWRLFEIFIFIASTTVSQGTIIIMILLFY